MKFNKKRLVVLAALLGLAVAGGAAYTNSNDNSALVDGFQVTGYGSLAVSGAVLKFINYNLDNTSGAPNDGDGTTSDPAVTSVTFVTEGNTSNAEGYVGFNQTGVFGASCTGTYDTNTSETYYDDCGLPGGANELVNSITSTEIVVAPTTPPTT